MKFGISFLNRIKKRLWDKRLDCVNILFVQHLDQIIVDNTGTVKHQINKDDYERGREVKDA